MTNRLRCILPLLAVVLLVPAPARADGLLSWLGRLSGPGPFLGANVSVCLPLRDTSRSTQTEAIGVILSCKGDLRTGRVDLYVDAGAGLAWENNLNYAGQDVAGKSERVTFVKVGSSAMYTAFKSLDVGIGGGIMIFNGPRFSSFVSPYIQPVKLGFRPLVRFKGAAAKERDGWLVLTANWTILLDTITGAKFGAPADPLHVRYESLPQFGVSIDLPRLLRAAR